jgi:hypothetical protein
MMRFACIMATESGINVCAPIHDAFLIEADADAIDDEVARMQEIMRRASLKVLPNFPLRTEAKIIRYPKRFVNDLGKSMWKTILRLLKEVKHPKPTVAKWTI